MKITRLVIVSGMSGAGKSTALNVLEDSGFFCVDNLPVALIPKFLELIEQTGEVDKAALVIDVRGKDFLKDFSKIHRSLQEEGYEIELLFFTATDEMLIRRFSETRRRHPMARGESPNEGIEKEHELLKDIKDLSNHVIDTSDYNVHDLKDYLKELLRVKKDEKLILNLISFGYKYGIPSDADIVMDVRFIQNPYFIDELKGKNGTDKEVRDFVIDKADKVGFIDKLYDFLDFTLPLYRKEGKTYLTVAVGCTGGRHRSVALIEEFQGRLKKDFLTIRVKHKDLDK